MDADTALTESVCKPVWDVVLARRAHDEELREQLDELRRQLGKRRGPKGPVTLPPKLEVDLGHHEGDQFVRGFDTRLVEMTTASWDFWYGLLEHYAEREGHTRLMAKHMEDGDRLGGCVYGQRAAYSKGKLDADRIRRLEKRPGWTWNAQAARSVSISRATSDAATQAKVLDVARETAGRLIPPDNQPK